MKVIMIRDIFINLFCTAFVREKHLSEIRKLSNVTLPLVEFNVSEHTNTRLVSLAKNIHNERKHNRK